MLIDIEAMEEETCYYHYTFWWMISPLTEGGCQKFRRKKAFSAKNNVILMCNSIYVYLAAIGMPCFLQAAHNSWYWIEFLHT